MDANEIKVLTEKYFEGMTSVEEERLLLDYFSGDNVDASLMDDCKFFMALNGMRGMPEGDEETESRLRDRLSRQIDGWNMVEKTSIRVARRIDLRWFGGLAASLLLVLSLGLYFNSRQEESPITMQDTFSDPRDAAAETQRALMKFSVDLNKGLDKINEITE